MCVCVCKFFLTTSTFWRTYRKKEMLHNVKVQVSANISIVIDSGMGVGAIIRGWDVSRECLI